MKGILIAFVALLILGCDTGTGSETVVRVNAIDSPGAYTGIVIYDDGGDVVKTIEYDNGWEVRESYDYTALASSDKDSVVTSTGYTEQNGIMTATIEQTTHWR